MSGKKIIDWEELREKVIGLGEQSARKSYYPELQKKLDELKAFQDDLLTLFDSTHDAIFIHDIKGVVFDVNKPMLNMYGLASKEEALQYSIAQYTDLNTPASQIAAIWDLLKENPDNVVFEWKARKPQNGVVFDVEVALRPVKWKNQDMIVAVVRDISHRKKIENEKNELLKSLVEAKKMAEEASIAKSEFLSNMSHEIRTPMNTIIGILDVLAEHSLPKEDEELIATVRKSGSLLLEIINNVLDLSKIEAGLIKTTKSTFKLIDTLEPLLKTMQLNAEKKGLNFTFDIDKSIPLYLEGDSTHLKQILFNLLSNAIKFTNKGTVSLFIRQLRLDKEKKLVTLSFEVKDTGIGILQEVIPHIFDRFNQGDREVARKYGGTGLGLSITRKLVELLSGELTVESQLGLGSCFRVQIPLELSRSLEFNHLEKEKKIDDFTHWKGKRLLIVDDAEENRQLLHLYLRKTGLVIDDAINGEEACAKFVQNSYDLVLMDIAMPIMDGYAALKFIREYEIENKRSLLPIIACTAFALTDEKDRSLQAGFSYHLAKPITKAVLLQTLESFIKK